MPSTQLQEGFVSGTVKANVTFCLYISWYKWPPAQCGTSVRDKPNYMIQRKHSDSSFLASSMCSHVCAPGPFEPAIFSVLGPPPDPRSLLTVVRVPQWDRRPSVEREGLSCLLSVHAHAVAKGNYWKKQIIIKKKNGLHPGFKLCSSISMETDCRALTFVWSRRRSFLRVSTIARELARLPEVVVTVACGVLSACHVILKERKKSTPGTFHFP